MGVRGSRLSESEGTEPRDPLQIERLLRNELTPDIEIQRRLGEETFGILYLAREPKLRREVVVNVLRPEYATDRGKRRRFRREARAAASISHPNVVPVFRVGTLESGVPFLVQPYLGECTLGERLKALGAFDARKVRGVLVQVASALAAAHDKGIVHRDVRPEAVRCEDSSDRVLLTDFGLAGILESAGLEEESITGSGEIMSNWAYICPEQARGDVLTDRADVYGLGALGWRLLVGTAARFPRPDERTGRYWRSLGHDVDDRALVDLIRRCLSKRPMHRPTATDVANELQSSEGRRGSRPGDPITDLLERRIPHVVGLYLLTVLTLLSVASDLPDLAGRPLMLLMAFTVAGFLATLVVTWFHGKKGKQEIGRFERWLLGAIAGAWLVASAIVWVFAPT